MTKPIRYNSMVAAMILTCVLLGGGCVKIDATLGLKRDGSGTLRALYGMPTFLVKQVEMTRQWTRALVLAEGASTNAPLPALDIPMIFDEAVLKSKFAAMSGDGVVLESLKTRDQGGWKYVDFTIKFSQLESLMKQSFLKDCSVAFKRLGDDSCKLAIGLPECGGAMEGGREWAPDTQAKLTPFLNGFRVVVRIDLPDEIRNSTSTMSDLRRATWEWDYDKDVHVLENLSQEKMIVVFDGSKTRIRDFEKPAQSARQERK